MSPEELRGVQMVELELLCEVDRICRLSEINYRIAAGTLLGAVRHGGFIPWDDDADVHFKREEYLKFREACKVFLNTDKFYFQDYEETCGYRWGYGKLRRKDSLFVRNGQEHMPYEQGIFIDLFIDDYVPDNYLLRCLCAAKCFFYRKAFWSVVGKKTAKGVERFVYICLSIIPEKVLKKSFGRFEKKRNNETKWVRPLTFPAPTRDYAYPAKLWDTFTEIKFEGITFKTFGNFDAYLLFKYGDYMDLPPVSERKTHPISQLKLPGG
ncbi:MAG: LicD family protein [Bacteroidales bacterium]|jgi:lipopolysaccharide cholinephosphotransferase|nr:LicD family protein [Bacteroidales bacterium]